MHKATYRLLLFRNCSARVEAIQIKEGCTLQFHWFIIGRDRLICSETGASYRVEENSGGGEVSTAIYYYSPQGELVGMIEGLSTPEEFMKKWSELSHTLGATAV